MPTIPVWAAALQICRRFRHAPIVETHAVDHGAVLCETKQTRLRIARLGPGRDGAAFDKAETELGHGVRHVRILVEARRQTYGIGKVQAQHVHRQARIVLSRCRQKGRRPARQRQCRIVGALRRQQAQERGWRDGKSWGLPIASRQVSEANRHRRPAMACGGHAQRLFQGHAIAELAGIDCHRHAGKFAKMSWNSPDRAIPPGPAGCATSS